MTALLGIAVFLAGVGLCVAVRDLLDADCVRRRRQMQACRARGDHQGAIRAACRPPQPGWLMVLLSVAGGIAMAQGLIWFFSDL